MNRIHQVGLGGKEINLAVIVQLKVNEGTIKKQKGVPIIFLGDVRHSTDNFHGAEIRVPKPTSLSEVGVGLHRPGTWGRRWHPL